MRMKKVELLSTFPAERQKCNFGDPERLRKRFSLALQARGSLGTDWTRHFFEECEGHQNYKVGESNRD